MHINQKALVKRFAKEYVLILKIIAIATVIGMLSLLLQLVSGTDCTQNLLIGEIMHVIETPIEDCLWANFWGVVRGLVIIIYSCVWIVRGTKGFYKSIRWAIKTSK